MQREYITKDRAKQFVCGHCNEVCSEEPCDPSNGDFDTIGVWYVMKPDKEKDTIERFFKESPDGWEEISKQEYFERVGENNG